MVVTPESGPFSQMMLNMTRSLGDFYHQDYGVTWKPEVVRHRMSDLMGESQHAVLCVASDGVWDMWTFERAMEEVVDAMAVAEPDEQRKQVMTFFETSKRKGEETFGDSADNLTGIVVHFTRG